MYQTPWSRLRFACAGSRSAPAMRSSAEGAKPASQLRSRAAPLAAHRLVLRSTRPGSRRHASFLSHHVQLPKWPVKYARASSVVGLGLEFALILTLTF